MAQIYESYKTIVNKSLIESAVDYDEEGASVGVWSWSGHLAQLSEECGPCTPKSL